MFYVGRSDEVTHVPKRALDDCEWTVPRVMNRGHEQRDILLEDVERQEWMRLLDRVAIRL